MKIATVGAGPAGRHLARLLADTEHEILFFDHRAAYEKPRGGGLCEASRSAAERRAHSSAGDSPT